MNHNSKNLNIVWRNHGTYNVYKIWKITKNIKTKRIYIDQLIHNLDKKNWTIDQNHYISPNQVLNDPYSSLNDFYKIIHADLSFPIIIYQDNHDLDILDGLHRLAKSILLQRKTISVKYITNKLLLKCKI